jgi:predicted 3-demethylubiquinone-9 3-methyltransferase (glyoxalase superfamily)
MPVAKIVPHLWFATEAKQAAELYTSLIPGSQVNSVTTLRDTPSGDCDVVSFNLAGQPFMAISAGPMFTFNRSTSFHIKCRTTDEVDALWQQLSPGGKVLMELGTYPFSQRYGWLQDRYGLSWQIIHAGNQEIGQRIVPVLMFVGSVCGKAEEAMRYYASVFPNGKVDILARYGNGQGPDKEGTVQYASFVLAGVEFGAMDSARKHEFGFNEAISFIVKCDDQQEIDYYWSRLSHVPESEQCGWVKDRYGVSWQIAPRRMDEMMSSGSKEQIGRVTKAFLKMKKFDLAELERAYGGKQTVSR